MANEKSHMLAAQLMVLVKQLPADVKRGLWETLAAELGEPDDLATILAEGDEEDEFWEDEEGEGFVEMDRRELLAAETFSYSYANYADHLAIEHVRFAQLMPDAVDALAEAEDEGWDDARLAEAIEVTQAEVPLWRQSYRRALEIVDAPTPAESFRRGVRYSIQDAVREGLADDNAIEKLVVQICYRAADLGYLLDLEGELLSTYSKELRDESALPEETRSLMG
ncbi:MAG TPA: hypothetical protein VLC52_13260 [Anaerolineae bacterium]|nr:hypothetical protein [Anaerolineae bacterium]